MTQRWIALCAAMALMGCSSVPSPDDIVAEAPQGRHRGENWTAVGASAAVGETGFDAGLNIRLMPYTLPCTVVGGEGREILITVPAAEGEYELDGQPLVTNPDGTIEYDHPSVAFHQEGALPLFANEGFVVVEALSAVEVTFGMVASVEDQDSWVNGRFTTEICP